MYIYNHLIEKYKSDHDISDTLVVMSESNNHWAVNLASNLLTDTKNTLRRIVEPTNNP